MSWAQQLGHQPGLFRALSHFNFEAFDVYGDEFNEPWSNYAADNSQNGILEIDRLLKSAR